MFENRWALRGLILFTLFFLMSVLDFDAWARVGGGRSMGSRGSRSYTAPRMAPAPTPANPSLGSRQPYTSPAPSPLGGGGFFRGIAGGILGGMIGGMLFRSLGFAGSGAGFGGGFGLMDLLLIGALLYGIYRFTTRRRSEAPAETPAGTYYRDAPGTDARPAAPSLPAYRIGEAENDLATGLRHLRQMDPHFDEKRFTDSCTDQFFQIQGAWANRDMSGVRNLLTEEMYQALQEDAEKLKAKRQINRLDNIAVRLVEIVELWQEGGEDFITVRFYANLIDYTIDEQSGQVVSGSKSEPVKFNEYWTFARPVGDHPWKLTDISQAK